MAESDSLAKQGKLALVGKGLQPGYVPGTQEIATVRVQLVEPVILTQHFAEPWRIAMHHLHVWASDSGRLDALFSSSYLLVPRYR